MALEELRSTFIKVFNTQELVEALAKKLPFENYKLESIQGSIKNSKPL